MDVYTMCESISKLVFFFIVSISVDISFIGASLCLVVVAFMVCLLHFTLHALLLCLLYVSVCVCVCAAPTQISPSRNIASYMASRCASTYASATAAASAFGREFLFVSFIHKISFFRLPAAATRHTCPQ